MKKSILLAVSLLAFNFTPVFGQPGAVPPPVPTYQQRLAAIQASAASALQSESSAPALTKFNLDFAGGPPVLLVEAIKKATGKPLNVIIPANAADADLPPLKMNDVVMPQLFEALAAASRETTTVHIQNMPPGALTQLSSSYGFNTADSPITDSSIWYFHAERPSPPAVPAPEKVSVFYSLSPYLDRGFTVDDITTAIQTGWKMAGDTATPELSYHKETKMLIAFGEPNKLDTIQKVLAALPSSKLTRNEVEELKRNVQNLQTQLETLSRKIALPAAPQNSVELKQHINSAGD